MLWILILRIFLLKRFDPEISIRVVFEIPSFVFDKLAKKLNLLMSVKIICLILLYFLKFFLFKLLEYI